jgi:DNA polymerase III epsilon subunit-like protein
VTGFLALRDRAFALLSERASASETELLEYVYGGRLPALVRSQLLEPLLNDPRLERDPRGDWRIARPPQPAEGSTHIPVTALALVATGPRPPRGCIVSLAALHVRDGQVVERFTTRVRPAARVPKYVAEHVGIDLELLDDLPAFEEVADALVQFLGDRPVLAQEVLSTWAFVEADVRRAGRGVPNVWLLDLNELATWLLELGSKPSLSWIARRFEITCGRIEQPEEQARVLALVAPDLLARATERGLDPQLRVSGVAAQGPLRRGRVMRDLPDLPGVYVLRDAHQQALYVGKARRLNARLREYVHRPLGVTRRLEGLVDAVRAIETDVCDSELHALILETRRIRDLHPRFNTQRDRQASRLWLRLPVVPPSRPGKRQLAPRRLSLVDQPDPEQGEHIGPFRNSTAARQARDLARAVFELDHLRHVDRVAYEAQLALAWRFLHGEIDPALEAVRHQYSVLVAAHDQVAAQRFQRLLAQVREYDPARVLLPADPRHSRYAVVRPGPRGVEVFVVDRLVLVAESACIGGDLTTFCAELLATSAPRTEPADAQIVLYWLGSQRRTARVILLPDEANAATEALELAVWETGSAGGQSGLEVAAGTGTGALELGG